MIKLTNTIRVIAYFFTDKAMRRISRACYIMGAVSMLYGHINTEIAFFATAIIIRINIALNNHTI